MFVSGHINERDHSGAIHTVKVACGILLDTVTGTVKQRVSNDAIYRMCYGIQSQVFCWPVW